MSPTRARRTLRSYSFAYPPHSHRRKRRGGGPLFYLHPALGGLIGCSRQRLQSSPPKRSRNKKNVSFNATNAWLVITDKYGRQADPRHQRRPGAVFPSTRLALIKTYQTYYSSREAHNIARGRLRGRPPPLLCPATEEVQRSRQATRSMFGVDRFDKLSTWGWFYCVITQPMF